MFNADDLKMILGEDLNSEPQLVIIPVNNEYGVIAVMKPIGNGKAACVAFSPATKLDNPFKGYRPHFLRKIMTTDFLLRTGSLRKLSLDKPSAMTLQQAVVALLKDFDKVDPASIKEIDMRRPTNASSSPEVSSATYSAPASVPFERALAHLVGLEFTMAARAKQQAEILLQNVNATVQTPAPAVEVQAGESHEAHRTSPAVGVAQALQDAPSPSVESTQTEALHTSNSGGSHEEGAQSA